MASEFDQYLRAGHNLECGEGGVRRRPPEAEFASLFAYTPSPSWLFRGPDSGGRKRFTVPLDLGSPGDARPLEQTGRLVQRLS